MEQSLGLAAEVVQVGSVQGREQISPACSLEVGGVVLGAEHRDSNTKSHGRCLPVCHLKWDL